MGWWGHGVMDGDGPSDAAYGIKLRALSGEVKDGKFTEEFAREVVDEYDDRGYDGALSSDDRALMKAYVHENVAVITAGAMKDAREEWPYGGPANLIAAGYLLIKEYDVKALPKAFKDRLRVAFECELGEEADNFDSPRARRAALRSAQRRMMRVRTF
jgi:hypothetical protein